MQFMSESVLPVFRSKISIVSSLHLGLKSIMSLFFVCGAREHSNFILLHVAV